MVYLTIAIGFILLILGGNLLVDGSVAVAKRMKVSPLLIGLTLVGFGTSTPELMTSLMAALQKADGIAIGNVVGSNIANILLVLGAAAVMYPVHVSGKKAFKRDSAFLTLSTIVLLAAILIGQINFLMGLMMCGALAYYVWYSYKTEKKGNKEEKAESEETNETPAQKRKALVFSVAKTIIGIALTMGGAKLLVKGAVEIAASWGVSQSLIGLTIVAVGTSLPELITSVTAALKKQSDIALGNVIGSNIYNALFILGASALIVPVGVPEGIWSDTLIMAAVTALLIFIGKKFGVYSRKTGLLFLSLYVLYIIYLIYKG